MTSKFEYCTRVVVTTPSTLSPGEVKTKSASQPASKPNHPTKRLSAQFPLVAECRSPPPSPHANPPVKLSEMTQIAGEVGLKQRIQPMRANRIISTLSIFLSPTIHPYPSSLSFVSVEEKGSVTLPPRSFLPSIQVCA